MKGGTNERTDGRTDERKSPCVLQDFVPFGAAAQKGEEGENPHMCEIIGHRPLWGRCQKVLWPLTFSILMECTMHSADFETITLFFNTIDSLSFCDGNLIQCLHFCWPRYRLINQKQFFSFTEFKMMNPDTSL